jgi:hypothetical protein
MPDEGKHTSGASAADRIERLIDEQVRWWSAREGDIHLREEVALTVADLRDLEDPEALLDWALPKAVRQAMLARLEASHRRAIEAARRRTQEDDR